MSNARQQILDRIRRSITPAPANRAADYAAIPRDYHQHGTLDIEPRIALFVDRLQDYGCHVFPCSDTQLTATISHVLRHRDLRRLLATAEIPYRWLPAGFDFFEDSQLTHDQIDSVEGVVTRCALAIAATGTVVLRHAHDEGRRTLTLIPDYHLCLVFDHQIVETVPEAIRQMAQFLISPITTISGPSATSDIEMTRIGGVHGPRTLDIILVKANLSAGE